VLVGLLFCALYLCFYCGAEWPHSGHFLVPLPELLGRLPLACLIGSLCGVFYYRSPDRVVVICPKCGKAGYANRFRLCACGGKVERIEEMRWQ